MKILFTEEQKEVYLPEHELLLNLAKEVEKWKTEFAHQARVVTTLLRLFGKQMQPPLSDELLRCNWVLSPEKDGMILVVDKDEKQEFIVVSDGNTQSQS